MNFRYFQMLNSFVASENKMGGSTLIGLISVENSSSANKFHVFYYNKKNISMFLSTAILQESCCVCAEGCGKAFSSAGTGM